MTAALSPEQVIAVVRELSADVRAVAVLDPAGAPLAGDPTFIAAIAALTAALAAPDAPPAAAPDAPAAACAKAPDELVVRTPDGVLFLARTATHVVAAAAGPRSLLGPTALDVRAAVLALAATPAPAPGTVAPPTATTPPEPALGLAIRAVKTAV